MTNLAFTESTRHHLQIIQDVISRLAGNSFSLKGWSLTLAAAVLVFTASKDANEQTGLFALAAVVPIVFFGLLDAYYLMLERRYRALYETVRSHAAGSAATEAARIPPFSIALTKGIVKEETFWGSLGRPAILGFHLPLLACVLLALVFLSG